MKLFYKLNKDLRVINSFNYGRIDKTILNSSNIDVRVLKLVVNNQLLTQQQIKNIEKLKDNASKMNINLEAIILK